MTSSICDGPGCLSQPGPGPPLPRRINTCLLIQEIEWEGLGARRKMRNISSSPPSHLHLIFTSPHPRLHLHLTLTLNSSSSLPSLHFPHLHPHLLPHSYPHVIQYLPHLHLIPPHFYLIATSPHPYLPLVSLHLILVFTSSSFHLTS